MLKMLIEESDQAVLSPPCVIACPGCSGAQPISTRTMTDKQLLAQLRLYDWNVKRAAYAVLVYKAKASDVALSSGLRLPDQSAHYLRLASLYRGSKSGQLHRTDEPEKED
ncbi:MAG: hypothetical protein RSD95_13235 [Clostridia bacterium]